MTPKQKAWQECSRYTRLRDAIDYCERMGIELYDFGRVEDILVQCCTCDNVDSWIKMEAGHFLNRGLGGGSGAYFDERNIHAQCKTCNEFNQGRPEEYRKFMLQKYGKAVIEALEFLHRQTERMTDLDFKELSKKFKECYLALANSV